MVECVGSYPRCDMGVRSVCKNTACFTMSSTILATQVDTRLTPVMTREEYRITMRRLEDRGNRARERRNSKR